MNITVDKLYSIINENDFVKEFKSSCPEYPYTPSILPKAKRIIVLGDIHGDYELAIKMLKLANLISINDKNVKWIGYSTIVVQVGDQIDSCRPTKNNNCNDSNITHEDSASDLKILNLFTNLDIQAREYGGMVISLLGNHELMNLLGNLKYVSKKNIDEFGYEKRKDLFKPGNEYGRMLGCTRSPIIIIGSNLFVHAGLVNGLLEYLKINEKNDINIINIAVKKWLLSLLDKKYVEKIIDSSPNSLFWTRILGNIPPNVDVNDNRCLPYIDQVLKIFKIDKMFIGHTPQSFNYSSDINSTCSNTLWRVDNGSSKAFHNFDQDFIKTGKINNNRRAQVLEILNDNQFNIIS